MIQGMPFVTLDRVKVASKPERDDRIMIAVTAITAVGPAGADPTMSTVHVVGGERFTIRDAPASLLAYIDECVRLGRAYTVGSPR